MNPAIFYPTNKREVALLPLSNSPRCRFYISTRKGDIIVDWGDGIVDTYTVTKNRGIPWEKLGSDSGLTYINHSYTQNFTGNVKIWSTSGGLNDIYSISLEDDARFGTGATQDVKNKSCTQFNLTNEFVKQFPNIKYFCCFLYFYNPVSYGGSKLSGNWADIPDSLLSLQLRSLNIINAPLINVNNFSKTSNLEYFIFNNGGFIGDGALQRGKITGDLVNLPPNIKKIIIGSSYNTASLSYSGGRVWHNDITLVDIYRSPAFPEYNYTPLNINKTDIDNIFIDLDKNMSSGNIYLRGARSINSNDAVANLQARQISVTPAAAS